MKKKTTHADMANLSREERSAYEESVKQYRDLKNVTDTAFYDGEIKGRIKEKEETILNGHEEGFPADVLARLTKLPLTDVLKIIQKGRNQ